MGWELGHDERYNRWIGYGVIAYCDHPECNEEIDRGLSFVCGSDPYGGDSGCGMFFCSEHLFYSKKHEERFIQLCERCIDDKKHFNPKPEHPKWIKHLLTDASWEEWRLENNDEVEKFEKQLKREC